MTVTISANPDQLPTEIVVAAKTHPEILEQFDPDPTLMEAVASEPDPDAFVLFRNDEVVFDGTNDCGYIGYGLEIAFNERRNVADALEMILEDLVSDRSSSTTMWTH